ncbi:MAG: rhomboid family intramembrane serine protease [Thermoprotei archaeon]
MECEAMKSTLVLMALVALGFAVGYLMPTNYLYLFILVNEAVLKYGLYYQLFTAVLITPSLTDFLFNEASLAVIYGFFRSEGGWKELPVFFISGVLGNLFTVAFLPPYTASSGASGGVIGLLAYYLARDAVLRGGSVRDLYVAIAFLGFVITFSASFPNVNNVAHIGGAVAGLALGVMDSMLYKRSKGSS